MKRKFTGLIIILGLSLNLEGQYLVNPSFEGSPGLAQCPPDWVPFGMNSTPDTDPLTFDMFYASQGKTFLTLVSRGPGSLFPNTFESCQTELEQSLSGGVCYNLIMDLASRDDLSMCGADGITYYNSTSKLRIYGSNSSTTKGTLLFDTGPIFNTTWESYSALIKPGEEISHLVLEIGLVDETIGFGNVIMDNFSLSATETTLNVKLNENFKLADLPTDLTAGTGTDYIWKPTNGITCSNCQTTTFIDTVTSEYICTYLDEIGCPVSELFVLNIIPEIINPPVALKIPNVFTPNGDGINDRFYIEGLPPYSVLIIFNRSGQQVYTNEIYNNNWDGKDINNEDLPEGTYWYVLITPGLSGKYKGDVYILRDE